MYWGAEILRVGLNAPLLTPPSLKITQRRDVLMSTCDTHQSVLWSSYIVLKVLAGEVYTWTSWSVSTKKGVFVRTSWLLIARLSDAISASLNSIGVPFVALYVIGFEKSNRWSNLSSCIRWKNTRKFPTELNLNQLVNPCHTLDMKARGQRLSIGYGHPWNAAIYDNADSRCGPKCICNVCVKI